jgi:ABC-type multidrug transport system ATPase subunit
VTTHYIEEAKSSSFVGFVSNGYLLAQSSPQQLMDQYRVKTLEEVYYKLAIIRRRSRRMSLNPLLFNEERDAQEVETENKKFNKSVANDRFLSLDRMSALLWRNYLKLTRSPLMFICFYILTALIITLMSLVFNQVFVTIFLNRI